MKKNILSNTQKLTKYFVLKGLQFSRTTYTYKNISPHIYVRICLHADTYTYIYFSICIYSLKYLLESWY